jgi:uracil-DNA glycosylase family 4
VPAAATWPEQQAPACASLPALDAAVVACRACPRLVEWRERVARERRAAFRDQEYWGRPLPGFGPADAPLAVVGLAPAAHGGNRTGRIFTGDRSGDWLFAALHRAGLANQPTSVARDDGLRLAGVRVLAAVRCAPPGNAPTPGERGTCAGWLVRELQLLAPTLRAVLALGGIAWSAALGGLAAAGYGARPRPQPRFGHGARAAVGPITVVGSYHPSQQNTFTHRLTEPMLDSAVAAAVAATAAGPPPPGGV